METDVLIIGGGVIGMAIARELRRRGAAAVTIVDRGELGGEASWAAAGMLAPNIEAASSDTFHDFCVEALRSYPQFAADLRTETGVDIELDRTGTLSVAFDASELNAFEKHTARGFSLLSGDEIRDLEPWVSDNIVGGVLFPEDWQVENRKLVAALRSSLQNSGVEIVAGTSVSRLILNDGQVEGAAGEGFARRARTTVLATGAWTTLIQTGESAIPFTIKPIRGQMASFDTGRRRIGRVVFSERGYLVPRSDGRLLVGATVEDVGFENATTHAGIEGLRQAAIEIVPSLADVAIAESWSGLRPFVADALPVIGEVPGLDGLLVATAHFRNGILLAPRTAEIIADKIIDGVDSNFFAAFGAGRFSSPAKDASARI